MAIHILNAIVLYACLKINYIISNAFESRSNTGYTLVTKAKYIWMLKQSAINRAMWCFNLMQRFLDNISIILVYGHLIPCILLTLLQITCDWTLIYEYIFELFCIVIRS